MLFGSLVHLWLYNRLAVEPDRANRRALLLYQPMELSSANGRSRLVSRLWSQVMATCHLPLLPGWRNTILQSFQSRGWIKTLKGIGLQAYVIDLSDDAIEDVITQLIHSRELRATD